MGISGGAYTKIALITKGSSLNLQKCQICPAMCSNKCFICISRLRKKLANYPCQTDDIKHFIMNQYPLFMRKILIFDKNEFFRQLYDFFQLLMGGCWWKNRLNCTCGNQTPFRLEFQKSSLTGAIMAHLGQLFRTLMMRQLLGVNESRLDFFTRYQITHLELSSFRCDFLSTILLDWYQVINRVISRIIFLAFITLCIIHKLM